MKYPTETIVSLTYLEEVLGVSRLKLKEITENISDYYDPFDVRARGKSKWRHIDNPIGELKEIQKKIYNRILKKRKLPDYFTGGITGRSLVDNVRAHVNKEEIVCIDIKKYFPSISNKKVFKYFKEELGFSTDVSKILTILTTYKHHLPQGAPTSPYLANLTLKNTGEKIYDLCRENNLDLTIYIDDITFSGVNARTIMNEVISLIQKDGLAVSNKKIKIMRSGVTQTVTGLKVNRKINVTSNYSEEIRSAIYTLSSSNRVTKEELSKIWAKIQYVKNVSFKEGARLENYYLKYFKKVRHSFNKRALTVEYRKCSGKECFVT
jgi:hypothetical protein